MSNTTSSPATTTAKTPTSHPTKTPIGEICELAYGAALPERLRLGGNIPVYGSNGIVGWHKDSLTEQPTIIIGRKGSVGEVHLSTAPCWPIDTTYYIEAQPEKFDIRWLTWQLKSLSLGELHRSTAIPGLRREDVHCLAIYFPPLGEQSRIVAMLDRQMMLVDRITSAADERLQATRALPQAYLNEAFFSPQTECWPTFSLGDKAAIASGITLGRRLDSEKARLVPYLRVANVKDGFLDLQDLKSTLATPTEINTLQLRTGDILLTEGGDADKLGRGTYWRGEVLECIHQNHIFRVRLNDPRCLPEFVSAQLCSAYGKRYFLAHAKQTTGIATVNQRVIKNFPLKIPPLSEQLKIVAALERKIALADEIRRSAALATRSSATISSAFLRQVFGEAA